MIRFDNLNDAFKFCLSLTSRDKMIPTAEDLKVFIQNNDAGLSDHLESCEKMLAEYEGEENYEYCAILRDYIKLKNEAKEVRG